MTFPRKDKLSKTSPNDHAIKPTKMVCINDCSWVKMYESVEKFICFDMHLSDHLDQGTITDSLFQTVGP